MTATEFRKNLFQAFDRALHGECIEITYHGQTFRLIPEKKQSKLSRLVKRDTLNCPPDQLENARREMNQELMTEWERKWS